MNDPVAGRTDPASKWEFKEACMETLLHKSAWLDDHFDRSWRFLANLCLSLLASFGVMNGSETSTGIFSNVTGTLGKHVTFRSDSVGFQILQCRIKKSMTTIQSSNDECTERAGDYTGGILCKGLGETFPKFGPLKWWNSKNDWERILDLPQPPSLDHHKRFYGCFRERTQPFGSCVWTNESWTVCGTGKFRSLRSISAAVWKIIVPKPIFSSLFSILWRWRLDLSLHHPHCRVKYSSKQ